jgi:5'-methylthioadenosine phosphorylase
MDTMIGVIGGSGVYQMDGLDDAAWVDVESPFGAPSDQVLTGRLGGVAMAFLPRHGRGMCIRRRRSPTAPISTR